MLCSAGALMLALGVCVVLSVCENSVDKEYYD